MANKLPQLLNASFDKGYRQGHKDATRIVMRMCHMAFCIAMNKELGVGADRFERVRVCADKMLGVDVVNDVELTLERLSREYERITGAPIDSVIK